MGKKLTLLFSVLMLFGVFLFRAYAAFLRENPKTLAAGALAGEVRQAELLKGRLPMTMDTGGLQLCFREETLACDRETDTWYLPVDMDSGGWEAGSFSDAGEKISILPLVDYTVLNKQSVVAEGQQVPFLAWQEDEQACAVVYVVFTGLPVVKIETGANLNQDTVFAGEVVFYESCGRPDWTLTSAFEAHERGQTTRAFPKKGYRLNLVTVTSTGVVNENPKPVLGMRNSDSWIFYAIYTDGTKVRDKFNIELWNEFGADSTPYDAHYGTHMEYAELVVNGEYRGLYGILEPIDTSQLGVTDQEYLYKRTVGRELLPELFDEVEPKDYLTVLGMEIKGKEGYGSRKDWQCFQDFVKLLGASDAAFSEGFASLLYMDNAVDMWLYLQMLYGEDNIYKNMFFTFKREDEGYRMYLVPWDVDLTWGNVYTDDAKMLYTVFAPENAKGYLEWPFMDRILSLNVGDIRTMATERYFELRDGPLSGEHMQRVLEDCIHQVQDSGAFKRDAARWPDSHHDGNYDGLREFMEARMNFLDKKIKNMDEWIKERDNIE